MDPVTHDSKYPFSFSRVFLCKKKIMPLAVVTVYFKKRDNAYRGISYSVKAQNFEI